MAGVNHHEPSNLDDIIIIIAEEQPGMLLLSFISANLSRKCKESLEIFHCYKWVGAHLGWCLCLATIGPTYADTAALAPVPVCTAVGLISCPDIFTITDSSDFIRMKTNQNMINLLHTLP